MSKVTLSFVSETRNVDANSVTVIHQMSDMGLKPGLLEAICSAWVALFWFFIFMLCWWINDWEFVSVNEEVPVEDWVEVTVNCVESFSITISFCNSFLQSLLELFLSTRCCTSSFSLLFYIKSESWSSSLFLWFWFITLLTLNCCLGSWQIIEIVTDFWICRFTEDSAIESFSIRVSNTIEFNNWHSWSRSYKGNSSKEPHDQNFVGVILI